MGFELPIGYDEGCERETDSAGSPPRITTVCGEKDGGPARWTETSVFELECVSFLSFKLIFVFFYENTSLYTSFSKRDVQTSNNISINLRVKYVFDFLIVFKIFMFYSVVEISLCCLFLLMCCIRRVYFVSVCYSFFKEIITFLKK